MDVLENAYSKVDQLLTRFQPVLEIYWRNQKFDLNLLVHERLRNPTDILTNTIKLFNYQTDLFASSLPLQVSIGLLQVDGKDARDRLLPCPKNCIAQMEEIIVSIIFMIT